MFRKRNNKDYKDLSIREFTKAAGKYEGDRVLRPGGRLILRDMTMDSAAVRWFCNHIEMPVINLAGHGDVRVYGRDEVDTLCRKAGLKMERFDKRGFCRMHCVARKPQSSVPSSVSISTDLS